MCNVNDFIDSCATDFLAAYNVLSVDDLERVLDIKKELVSSDLHLLIFNTVLTLYLVGLLTGCQVTTFITETMVRTFLAAFVLQALLKKAISSDERVFPA